MRHYVNLAWHPTDPGEPYVAEIEVGDSLTVLIRAADLQRREVAELIMRSGVDPSRFNNGCVGLHGECVEDNTGNCISPGRCKWVVYGFLKTCDCSTAKQP